MKIGIAGLGLIGGSIFKDLRKLNYDVIAVSQSQSGENIYKDYEVLKDCQIVFVCTPMNKTLEILDKLETVLNPDTTVTDVCSLKSFVCQKPRSYKFVPSHPMAGTENKGYENSFEGMFKNKKWVITPVFGQDERLNKIIQELGSEIIIAAPDEHDTAAALISHMPMLIAQALFKTAQDNELALKMASSGFRDMTRLALSNEEMAQDMINMNSQNIQNCLQKLCQSVKELTNSSYLSQIKDIKSRRKKMFK